MNILKLFIKDNNINFGIFQHKTVLFSIINSCVVFKQNYKSLKRINLLEYSKKERRITNRIGKNIPGLTIGREIIS